VENHIKYLFGIIGIIER